MGGVSGGFQEPGLFSEINPAELEAFDSSFPVKAKEVTETQRAHNCFLKIQKHRLEERLYSLCKGINCRWFGMTFDADVIIIIFCLAGK